jgi:hypothetical protein
MYCNNCNNLIDDDSLYCRYCGNQVDNIINNDDIEVNLEENGDPPIIKQPSLRWFNFLVKFLMPLWIFFSPISMLGEISSVIRNYYGSFSYYTTNPLNGLPNTVTLVMTICMIIFLFISWKELRIFSIRGYKFTIIFFILTIFSPVITMLVYLPFYIREGANINFYYAFVNMCSAAIICIPNLVYLRKRKLLFTNNELTKQIFKNKTDGANDVS